MVFDFGVNAGPARALRLLRQTGGGTPTETIERFAAARIAYYRALPGFAAFGRGWLKRVEQVRVKALAHQRAGS
jgi:lysozyme family protein